MGTGSAEVQRWRMGLKPGTGHSNEPSGTQTPASGNERPGPACQRAASQLPA